MYGMDTTCANLFNKGSEWKRPDSFCLISGYISLSYACPLSRYGAPRLFSIAQ